MNLPLPSAPDLAHNFTLSPQNARRQEQNLDFGKEKSQPPIFLLADPTIDPSSHEIANPLEGGSLNKPGENGDGQ